jgi:hypothetical protein
MRLASDPVGFPARHRRCRRRVPGPVRWRDRWRACRQVAMRTSARRCCHNGTPTDQARYSSSAIRGPAPGIRCLGLSSRWMHRRADEGGDTGSYACEENAARLPRRQRYLRIQRRALARPTRTRRQTRGASQRVAHEVVGCRAMPIQLTGRCIDAVAGSDGDESTAARLSTSETFDDGKSLSPGVAGPLGRAG